MEPQMSEWMNEWSSAQLVLYKLYIVDPWGWGCEALVLLAKDDVGVFSMNIVHVDNIFFLDN